MIGVDVFKQVHQVVYILHGAGKQTDKGYWQIKEKGESGLVVGNR